MWSAFNQTLSYELNSIKESWYKIMLISILPFVVFSVIISIFHSGVVRELPIVVVDNDHSSLSRMVSNHLNASPTLKIAHMAASTKEALEMVESTKAYALVVIPKDFRKDTLLQKNPKITAMINTQYILVGKIIHSAISTTIMHSSAEVEYVKKLADLQEPYSAKNSVKPVGIQVTPFFNTYQNYYYFLVSAMLPSLWQIFIIISTIVAIGSIFKHKKEQMVFENSEHMTMKLMGLMFPYTIAYMFIGILFTLYIYTEWAFQGSFTILFLGMFITIIAYQAIGLYLFTTGFDYARTLGMAAVYSAPAFAFMGITFPVYNMNGFALFWRDILPITHYAQLQLSQANYGADIWLDIGKLFTLTLFLIIAIPAVIRFKKRLGKEKSDMEIS